MFIVFGAWSYMYQTMLQDRALLALEESEGHGKCTIS